MLNALGVASVAGCSAVSAGACAVLAIGAAASVNQLYGDVQQVITGKEAKSALVQALVAFGYNETDASRYQDYVDTGVLVISVAVVGGQQVYRIASRGNIPGLGQVKNVEFNPTTGQVTNFSTNRATTQYADGSFSVSDWTGYPASVPRPPVGTVYRLLSGTEYAEARKLANSANAQLRRQGGVPVGYEIHEIVPVKYGGSPTDPANKVYLPRATHRSEMTPWWNRLQMDLKR